MVWGASTTPVARDSGARVTYLEAKADGGDDTEDGGPGGGPVAWSGMKHRAKDVKPPEAEGTLMA